MKRINVEVIDLTSNDDIEDVKVQLTPHSNQTLQAIEKDKQVFTTENEPREDSESQKSMEMKPDERIEPTQLQLQLTMNSIPSSPIAEGSNPLYSLNLSNGFKKPPKEQFKTTSKYNKSMQCFRGYNSGFRIFAERNYFKAQAHALQNEGKSFVHNTLLNWWTKLSTAEKEQYTKFGGMLRVKNLKTLQNNPRIGMFYQKKLPTTQTTLNDNPLNIVNADKAIRIFEDRFNLLKSD